MAQPAARVKRRALTDQFRGICRVSLAAVSPAAPRIDQPASRADARGPRTCAHPPPVVLRNIARLYMIATRAASHASDAAFASRDKSRTACVASPLRAVAPRQTEVADDHARGVSSIEWLRVDRS